MSSACTVYQQSHDNNAIFRYLSLFEEDDDESKKFKLVLQEIKHFKKFNQKLKLFIQENGPVAIGFPSTDMLFFSPDLSKFQSRLYAFQKSSLDISSTDLEVYLSYFSDIFSTICTYNDYQLTFDESKPSLKFMKYCLNTSQENALTIITKLIYFNLFIAYLSLFLISDLKTAEKVMGRLSKKIDDTTFYYYSFNHYTNNDMMTLFDSKYYNIIHLIFNLYKEEKRPFEFDEYSCGDKITVPQKISKYGAIFDHYKMRSVNTCLLKIASGEKYELEISENLFDSVAAVWPHGYIYRGYINQGQRIFVDDIDYQKLTFEKRNQVMKTMDYIHDTKFNQFSLFVPIGCRVCIKADENPVFINVSQAYYEYRVAKEFDPPSNVFTHEVKLKSEPTIKDKSYVAKIIKKLRRDIKKNPESCIRIVVLESFYPEIEYLDLKDLNTRDKYLYNSLIDICKDHVAYLKNYSVEFVRDNETHKVYKGSPLNFYDFVESIVYGRETPVERNDLKMIYHDIAKCGITVDKEATRDYETVFYNSVTALVLLKK